MIRDLSLTLRAILDDPGLATSFPELAAAQISFDRPGDQFNPQQTTVDLFLYDVRENVDLRNNEPIVERQNGQVITHRPALRMACSYLVTAWPVGGEEVTLQEHRLLSQVLQVLSRYPTIPPTIPPDYLQGGLRGQEPPLPMVTALVDPQKNLSEFWTALGNKLRPSLTVTVTISMDVLTPETAPMVITEHVRLGERTLAEGEKIKPETLEEFFRISGRVTGAGNMPVEAATVTLVGRGLSGTTNAEGRYTLSMIASGAYTLRVQKDAAVKEVSITVPAPKGSNYNVQLT